MLHSDLPRLLPPLPAQELSRPLHPASPTLLPLLPGERLHLEHTFRCGQIFRWRCFGDTWYGPHGPASLAVRLAAGGVEVRALGPPVSVANAWRFLGLDVPLAEVEHRLDAEEALGKALRAAPGLRLLRQDPWQCLAGYIVSQWNNIPKIELSTGRLASRWGNTHRWSEIDPGAPDVDCFPAPEALAPLSEEELRFSALGYRSRYLLETARRLCGEETGLGTLASLSYNEALRSLLKLPGIGRKVADCILLFALDQPHACPVDVWVRRVIHELYPAELTAYLPDAASRAERALTPREYEAITQFAWDRWGRLAGYAQQYLFHTRRIGSIGPDLR